MYLISQLWWFLLLAFLLGALLGYLLWSACGRRRIETHYERSNKELTSRLGILEQERNRFTGAAVEAEGDNAKLKAEIAGLQSKLADTSGRMNAAVDAADGKLKSYVDSVRHREDSMSSEIEKLKKETADARKAWDTEKATAKAREDKLANDAALAKKNADDAQRKYADDLKAVEKRISDEMQKKHAEDLRKAQENVRSELAASHAAELKKVQEQAKQQEAKVLTLTQADTGARKEIEDAKARHTAELKKAREDAAADAAKKHAEDLKKARDQSLAEAQAKHAEELKKARDQVKAELSSSHSTEIRKAQEQTRAELAAIHAAELKKVQEQAKQHEAKVLTLTQADTRARKEFEDAKARHTAEIKKARDDAAAEASPKHAEEVTKARSQALAEVQAKHAEEVKKAREEATAVAKRAHDDELARFKREAVTFVSPPPSSALSSAPSPAPSAAPSSAEPTASAPARGKAPASIGSARGGKADDLKLIWGVGPEIEKLLNQNGIYHFDQIAGWTKADLAWFDQISKAFEGRVEREKWVEQSMKLVTGWRPDSDIGAKPAGLSVLKEARDGKADDLKLIWGVGPKLEKLLNGAGFFHFDQIAKWGPADIEWVDSQLGEFAGRAVRDKWVEQCKKLATGWRPASNVGEKPE